LVYALQSSAERFFLLDCTVFSEDFRKTIFRLPVHLLRSLSQFLGLGGNTYLGGKIFVFIMCLKQFSLGTTKFGDAQKI